MSGLPRPADQERRHEEQPTPAAPVAHAAGPATAGVLAEASVTPAAPGTARGPVEELYPFLYAGTTDLTALLAQATASTVAKTRELAELRVRISGQSSEQLGRCARDAAARFAAGGKLLTFGNGGSATDAQQVATLFLCPGRDGSPLPAICLAADAAVLTALSNDVGVEVIFARQIAALGSPGDIALGLSTSGNSENLLRAFDEASRRGMMTIGIAGYGGGAMAELDSIDFLFVAPSESVHRIQEAQTTFYHILWELIMAEQAQSGQHE